MIILNFVSKSLTKQFLIVLSIIMAFFSQEALSKSLSATNNSNSVVVYKELELKEKQILNEGSSINSSLKTKDLKLKKSNPIQKKPKKDRSQKQKSKQKHKKPADKPLDSSQAKRTKKNNFFEQPKDKSKKATQAKKADRAKLTDKKPKEQEQKKLEDDEFNLSFLKKNQLGGATKIDALTQSNIPPGKYKVETSLNSNYLSSFDLDFILENKKLAPCISAELLQKLSLKQEFYKKISEDIAKNQCLTLKQAILGSTFEFNTSNMQLEINIPYSVTNKYEQYSFDKNAINKGANALFFNYRLQHYESIKLNKDHNVKNSKSSLAMNIGANMGALHLRSYLSLSSDNFSNANFSYGSIYGHFDLIDIYSQVLFGLISTSTLKTSNVGILGINFSSDANMRPINQQGYAPEITAFANTNAVVIIKQNDVEIYRTNVERGNFVISDLTNISLDSNLSMTIYEADGVEKTTEIPVIYIASVLRKNTYEYNTAFGFYTNNFQVNWKEPILSGELNYGVHNNVSLLTGLNLSLFRQELASMVVYNSPIGNFNADLNLVHSHIAKKHYFGARVGVSYTNYFEETKTDLSIAAYNYSTNNYFSLNEVINLNAKNQKASKNSSLKHSFNLGIRQKMPMNLGSLNFSLSYNNYWNSAKSDLAFNTNYSIKIFNLNLALSYGGVKNFDTKTYSDTLGLSVSIPFANAKYAQGSFINTIYMYPNKSVKGNVPFQHDMGVGLSFNKLQNLYFGFNVTNNNNEDMSLSASVDWSLEKADLSSNFSYNTNNYVQFSFNANGALVLHKGGINFTKNLSNSFAIIEAKNANKALINSSYKIEKNGYAIVPSLSPYRANQFNLDASGLSTKLTFDKTSTKIFPGNYASPLIVFQTNFENSVILELNFVAKNQKNKSENVPSGSMIYNSENENVAFVGVNGRAYIKQKNLNGAYKAVWGQSEEESCNFSLNISEKEQAGEEIILHKIDCKN